MGQMLPSAIPTCQRWREVSTNINKKYERKGKPYLRFDGLFYGSTSQHWRSKQYTAAACAQKYYQLVLNILTEFFFLSFFLYHFQLHFIWNGSDRKCLLGPDRFNCKIKKKQPNHLSWSTLTAPRVISCL